MGGGIANLSLALRNGAVRAHILVRRTTSEGPETLTPAEVDQLTNLLRLSLGAEKMRENPPDLVAVEKTLAANWDNLQRYRAATGTETEEETDE